jgi:hypothetical protein
VTPAGAHGTRHSRTPPDISSWSCTSRRRASVLTGVKLVTLKRSFSTGSVLGPATGFQSGPSKIGDALTTRLKLTLDLRLEFLSAHLDGVHASTAQGEDEAPSIPPSDLRPFALRDLAPAVPVDRRRQPQLACKLLRRARGRHNLVRQLDRDRRHREPPLSNDSNPIPFSQATSFPDPSPTRRVLAAQTRSAKAATHVVRVQESGWPFRYSIQTREIAIW